MPKNWSKLLFEKDFAVEIYVNLYHLQTEGFFFQTVDSASFQKQIKI